MTETALIEATPLVQALALATEARDLGAMKDVRAVAAAFQQGAKARGMGIEAENQAAEIVIRSERAMGETLNYMAENGLRAGNGQWQKRAAGSKDRSGNPIDQDVANGNVLITLSDLGIAAKDAYRYGLLASIPAARFEALLANARATERLAKVDFYRAAKDTDRIDPKAVKRVQEMLGDDKNPAEWTAYVMANDALDVSQLPDDLLIEFGRTIKANALRYNEEKEARLARSGV